MARNKVCFQQIIACCGALTLLLCIGTACGAKESTDASTLAAKSLALLESEQTLPALECMDKAVKLAPHNARLLVNLGIMHQNLGNQKKAIKCFERVLAKDSADWRANLSLSKSLMLSGRQIESIAILDNMCKQQSTSFEGQYKLGEALLFFDRAKDAAEIFSNTTKLAQGAEKKSSSEKQLYLSMMRSGQFDRASALELQVCRASKATDDQVFIRAASQVSVITPDSIKPILDSALLNLNQRENAWTFFRLGQIFDTNAKFVAYDATKYGAWLKASELTYKQAIKLNETPPIFRIALAKNAAEQREDDALVDALLLAHAADPQDQLPGYLLSKLKPLQVASVNVAGTMPQSQLRLTRVQLAIDGLNCACKKSIIINSFKGNRGMVRTYISPKFPFVATVLLDETMMPVSDMMTKIAHKPLPEFNYRLLRTSSVSSAQEALALDLDGHNIVYPAFSDNWPAIELSFLD